MKHTYDELRRRIPLVDFAQAHGYEIDRQKGKKWPLLRHPSGDRVIVINPGHPANQGYFNPENDQDKGTLIQFVTNRLGWLFPEDREQEPAWNVNQILHAWLRMPFPERRWLAKTSAPSRHGEKVDGALFRPSLLEPLRDPGWLLSRGISRSTLGNVRFSERVLQCRIGGHVNVAFPYRESPDGPVVGAELRNYVFKGHQLGSARSRSLWFSRPPAELRSLVVCESALDALSHFELRGEQGQAYASFGGHLTAGQISCLRIALASMATEQEIKLVIGVDADVPGHAYAVRLQEAFPGASRDLPEGKDFNEMKMTMRSRSRLIL
jgi:hypothetical protein